ncbi:MAG: XdhC family protein, partial [Salaquimonas sp.]|nr:XdhC family protein [Salaquimonas sp.]
ILLTDLEDGSSRIVREGETVTGELGQAVEKAFRSGKSGTVEVDGRNCFLNVHVPPARIVVIGAVHISQALASMAKIAGFDLEIIDPRTAFATPERFAGVTLFADWPEDVLRERPLDRYTALAALTHDPKIDDFPLSAAFNAGCFYVGALGSRKTNAKRRERLVAAGLSEAQFERIAAPIGLDIGAASPAEIAVAVLAQIIEALRKRDLSSAADAGAMPDKSVVMGA